MNRNKLRNSFGGKCAYCGRPLGTIFHADHIAPIYRGWKEKEMPARAGDDTEDNIFPSCPRCNLRKNVLSIEEFRAEIAVQVERLRRDSPAFRLAEDYGLIAKTETPVIFWFEKYKP